MYASLAVQTDWEPEDDDAGASTATNPEDVHNMMMAMAAAWGQSQGG